MNLISHYFHWLQKDNPTGIPSRFPELRENYETSVPGIYCIGDLTGIPLIKLAAESGYQVIEMLKRDKRFTPGKSVDYDLIICGAGPAGIAAAIEAKKEGWKVLILEAATPFNTIKNFPAGKPIYVTPADTPFESALPFHDGTKESLLEEYNAILSSENPPIKTGTSVVSILQRGAIFEVQTNKELYRTQKVLVAIGSSGNARRLGVQGEELPKVYNQLIDPKEIVQKKVMIVGGGDSALETAIALAETGNRVSLSYRKEQFSRPKEHNLQRFNQLVNERKIVPYFNSNIKNISELSLTLTVDDSEIKIDNDIIFTMIGREIPISFFKRSKIEIEGEKNITWWIQLITMLLFFSMLYFGKAGNAFRVISAENSITTNVLNFLQAPSLNTLDWSLKNGNGFGAINFLLGWISALLLIPFAGATIITIIKKRQRYFTSPWKTLKYSYLFIAAASFSYVYISSTLGVTKGWVETPTEWYSLLYCTTMLLFGIRRIVVKPTRYVRWQTTTLLFIQIFFLYLLPFHLYKPLIADTFSSESWLITELFPQGKWSSFGFVLFWPLNINDFGTSIFWTWFPIFQTFVILPTLIYFWGKGVYCGWICSCGGMAETLGDEYRHKAPHGPKAKKWENAGQVVLLFSLIATIVHQTGESFFSTSLWGTYKFIVDIIFAGVLGLGIYFYFSGRFWCRYLCPLAALMHIYTKFSQFRIFADKKRCISCNICTKVCHMGIDVMNYANKGKSMNDIECVACSSCITSCPMDVLSFGRIKKRSVNTK